MIYGYSRDAETNTLVIGIGAMPEEFAQMYREGAFTVSEADLRGLPNLGLIEHVRINLFAGADHAELVERMEQIAAREERGGGCGECEGCKANADAAAEHVITEAERVAREAAALNGE